MVRKSRAVRKMSLQVVQRLCFERFQNPMFVRKGCETWPTLISCVLRPVQICIAPENYSRRRTDFELLKICFQLFLKVDNKPHARQQISLTSTSFPRAFSSYASQFSPRRMRSTKNVNKNIRLTQRAILSREKIFRTHTERFHAQKISEKRSRWFRTWNQQKWNTFSFQFSIVRDRRAEGVR